MEELKAFKRSIEAVLEEYDGDYENNPWMEGRKSAFTQIVEWLDDDIKVYEKAKELFAENHIDKME